MPYADNDYSFMFILNFDWRPTWQLHNARGHVAVGLGAQLAKKAALLDYEISALNITAKIPTWPVVDKAAAQHGIDRLYAEIMEAKKNGADVTVNLFTDSMFGASAEGQLQQTKDAKEPKILIIGLFGESAYLKTLTKRLKLASFE
jgi:hypothetical protein